MTATAIRPADSPSDGALSHRQILTILSGLVMGMFLAALDQTIVSTAIKTIGNDLHDLQAQAWVTTAFLITSTIAAPLFGKLSDIYGRKRLFMLAIVIFVAGSALCGLATSMYELAGFRAFQGIGAGGIMPLALAVIGDIIPPRERARYQGYMMAVFASASVLGPVLGGLLAGTNDFLGVAGWRWIFYINVPIAAVALIVIARVLKLDYVRRERRIDWWGSLMLVVGLVPLLVVAEQGQAWGWASAASFTCYLLGVAGLALFVWIQHRMGDDALLPLRLFRSRTFSVASGQVTIIGMAMFGGLSVIPLYLQIVKGASPTKSGLLLLPLVAGLMLASLGAGRLIARTGRYKIFPVVGSVLMVIGMGLLITLGADTALWTHRHLHGDLRHRARPEHAEPRAGHAERRARQGHGRRLGRLVVLPLRRRHAGHRDLPVHPVLPGRHARSPSSTPRPPPTPPTSPPPRPTPARSPRCTSTSAAGWTTPRSSAGWPSRWPTRSSSGSPPPATWSSPSPPSSSSPRSSCPPASRKFRCGSSPATRPAPRPAGLRMPWPKSSRRPTGKLGQVVPDSEGQVVSVEPPGVASSAAPDGDVTVQAGAAQTSSSEGFFRAEGDTLVPAAFATSPWGQVLHGRLIGGLTARAAEQARAGSGELACGRLTIDLFRSVPLAPVTVTTKTVRAGRRIVVLDVIIEQGDGPVGQGRAVLLRRAGQPAGTFRPPPDWGAPTPPELGPPQPAASRHWTPPWESWRVGGPDESGAGAMTGGLWIRDTHPLVTGERLTPLMRLAMAADLASPVSNSSSRGLSFINADYTVYLGREPQGEYVGIQPAGHLSDQGVAAGQCVLHDLHGPVAFAATAAVANPMMGSPAGNGGPR